MLEKNKREEGTISPKTNQGATLLQTKDVNLSDLSIHPFYELLYLPYADENINQLAVEVREEITFGLPISPIYVNPSGQVLEGYRYWQALLKSGKAVRVSTYVIDLDEDSEQEFIIKKQNLFNHREKTYREKWNEVDALFKIHAKKAGRPVQAETDETVAEVEAVAEEKDLSTREWIASITGLKDWEIRDIKHLGENYPEMLDKLDEKGVTLSAACKLVKIAKKNHPEQLGYFVNGQICYEQAWDASRPKRIASRRNAEGNEINGRDILFCTCTVCGSETEIIEPRRRESNAA